MQPGVPTVREKMLFGGEISLPVFDYPISAAENLIRAAHRDNPYWVPNGLTDFQSILPNEAILPMSEEAAGQIVCADFKRRSAVNWTFTDWFSTNWTFVVQVGGPMLTPGTRVVDDVTQWENAVKFPDLAQWDFDTYAAHFMKNEYNPKKVLTLDLGLGCTERFVSIMGGYTEAMVAFAEEPEACAAFFERFVDHEIELFDRLLTYYPLSMVTYHDDWGNEKDTFFSERMLEKMIYAPTKRLIDHIKSKDVIFELHSCGNIKRFIPYMIDMGVDFMQIQRRVIDFPAVKVRYGDKIGFCGGIEGLDFGAAPPSKEALIGMLRHTVDVLGKGGGLYMGLFLNDPELIWAAAGELYAYSREFYDRERGV
jgi:hypothetical protein